MSIEKCRVAGSSDYWHSNVEEYDLLSLVQPELKSVMSLTLFMMARCSDASEETTIGKYPVDCIKTQARSLLTMSFN
jgi:hypothetical protein